MQPITYNVKVDLITGVTLPRIEFTKGDIGTSRIIFSIFSNNEPVSLADKVVTVTIKKSDNVNVVYDIPLANIHDNNMADFYPDSNALNVPGTVLFTFELYDGASRITSKRMQYTVTDSLNIDDDVTSFKDYPMLVRLINDVKSLDIKENERQQADLIRESNEETRNSNELVRQQRETDRIDKFNSIKAIYDASTKTNTVAELTEARKGKSNLLEKIDEIDSELNDKANKNDVARISSGTPLFASSTANMTDITRNYVNTTDGYLYIYSGGVWIKTTVRYQSTGIADNSVTLDAIDKFTLNLAKNTSLLDSSDKFNSYGFSDKYKDNASQARFIYASYNGATGATGNTVTNDDGSITYTHSYTVASSGSGMSGFQTDLLSNAGYNKVNVLLLFISDKSLQDIQKAFDYISFSGVNSVGLKSFKLANGRYLIFALGTFSNLTVTSYIQLKLLSYTTDNVATNPFTFTIYNYGYIFYNGDIPNLKSVFKSVINADTLNGVPSTNFITQDSLQTTLSTIPNIPKFDTIGLSSKSITRKINKRRYSLFSLPSQYPLTLPCNIYTDGQSYKTDINPIQKKNTTTVSYYISPNGDDNNLGTKDSPFKTFYKAKSTATSAPTIYFLPGIYTLDNIGSSWDGIIDSQINCIGIGDVRIVNGLVPTFTLSNTNGVYQAPLTYNYAKVADIVTDKVGIKYQAVNSITDCSTTPNSYYKDTVNSIIYIHSNGTDPSGKLALLYTAKQYFKVYARWNPTSPYFENLKFYGSLSGKGCMELVGYNSWPACNPFLYNCGFYLGEIGVQTNQNCVPTFYKCECLNNDSDGFQYYGNTNYCEIECIGASNGKDDTTINPTHNNGSTSHDACKGIRINGMYFDNNGGNVTDATNGGYSINLGCASFDCCASSNNQGFSLQNSGTQTMLLYNCVAFGNVVDISSAPNGTIIVNQSEYETSGANGGTITVNS